jgi:hypothetical protein
VELRIPLGVHLVDHHLVPREIRVSVVLPVEARIDDDALGNRSGIVLLIEVEVGVCVRSRHVRKNVCRRPVDGPLDRLRVRVDQELVGVEAAARRRVIGAVDAVAVPLARADAGYVAVPVEGLAFGELDARLVIAVVE